MATNGDLAKTCSCGRQHTWLEWRSLPRVGFQVGADESGASAPKELRNCVCGSTISTLISFADLKLFLTNPTPFVSSVPSLDADRLTCRIYASAAKTVIALLEEERSEAFRRETIVKKQLVMAQTRIADLHRTLLLRGVGSSNE